MRLPPSKIQILLPLWGARYTRDFLDLCLPSLLAPGNIPALSKLAPCTLVLLVPVRDAATISQSPLWDLLQRCCEVRVEAIDGLVSESTSTVLTLAYGLAIRGAGHQAIETCFVLLVADYVLADGSLLTVVESIFAGASGVLAGNFQVEREKAILKLEGNKNDAGVLVVTSQALVELSFGAMHQATLAEIVDTSSRYHPRINRLFWRVDEHCMVGRFFLMHMIAIRPETSDFVIAAPSDYSLIPELCPSGNIVRMTDSDDYFAVECQPRGYHLPMPTGRRLDPRSVAGGVALWATSIHRENARHPLVFHSGPPSSRLTETIAVSGVFVSQVDALSGRTAMPFRHHPFWLRALDHHAATALAEQDPAQLAAITADPSIASATGLSGVSRLREIVLGRAPYFRPWHPRWLDVRALRQSLGAVVLNGRVAVVADVPARVRLWLARAALAEGAVSVTHIQYGDLPSEPGAGEAAFDSCLFLSPDMVSAELPKTLSCLAPLVRPGGAVVLGIGRIFSDTVDAPLSIIPPAEVIVANGRISLERTDGIAGEPRRLAVQRTMMEFARKLSGPPSIASLLSFAAAAGLAAMSLCYNRATVGHGPMAKTARFTSLFFTFRRSPIDSADGGYLHRRDKSGVSPQSKTGETVPTPEQLAGPESHLERASREPVAICDLARAAGFAMRER